MESSRKNNATNIAVIRKWEGVARPKWKMKSEK